MAVMTVAPIGETTWTDVGTVADDVKMVFANLAKSGHDPAHCATCKEMAQQTVTYNAATTTWTTGTFTVSAEAMANAGDLIWERTTRPDRTEIEALVTVQRGIAAALGALGATADEVARTLYDVGIRGVRGSSQDCAIARWVDSLDVVKEHPGIERRVGPMWTEIRNRAGVARILNPSPVAQFVEGFDGMRYPALLEGDARPVV